MASDVEMRPSPSPATSRRSSFAVPTVPVVHAQPSSVSIPLLVHSPSPDSPGPSHGPPSSASSSAPPPATTPTAAADSAAPTPSSPLTKPPSSAAAPSPSASASTTTLKPASSAKPRSTKPPRPRSPSPSPPPPVIPLRTIRLEIRLGGPSNYEVDIRRQAKETGQRPPTPPVVVKRAVPDSSDEDDEEDEGGASASAGPGKTKKKKKKKNPASEYYDTTDPFIDDSELAVDERQFFAQTKQQGFYVSSGEVALLKDKTPKKPKSKKISFATGLPPSLSAALPTTAHKGKSIEGTREAPITIDAEPGTSASTSISAPVGSTSTSVNGAKSAATASTSISTSGAPDVPPHTLLPPPLAGGGQKRKRQNSFITETGKRKRVVDETLFHPSLQAALKEMRELIKKENWENKGKFPPALKAPLARMAVLAIKLDEYDDDFFSLMPNLFPYNKFTMTKLIKRTVFSDHLALLTERQDTLLAQLKQLADDGFERAKEEWERNVVAWDKRQEKIKAAGGGGAAGGHEGTGTGSEAPTRHGTEEMDVDGPSGTQEDKDKDKDKDKEKDKDKDKEKGEGKEGKEREHGNNPPARRYRMTEQMKNIVWELVLLSNECCRLENEKNSLEGSVVQISDQGLRKVLYQKIVSAYPDGWMSSGQISRDVSAMKKKLEREAMEQENDD
ncbi:hypothetical protein JR316_0010810 [Psilocybe cubensis]|uniref:Uncharacterized protein n=2 Tax=Psilocybe cubensis TaxID=181762 RepID=A0ACB8GN54_PSICU|nr:hypothetical protein JR316_0010810 [Psilocybe cubensis]KAH9476894.1 hypothetical protein JR316_0010810 [Psilocybe cubensis]